MKVQNEHLAGLAASRGAAVAGVQGNDESQRQNGPNAAGDRVELSGLASRIAEAQAGSRAAQAARVRHLSGVYASGKYTVDTRELSRSMVEHAVNAALPKEP